MLYTSGSPASHNMRDALSELLSEKFLTSDEVAIVMGGDGFFFKMVEELPDETLIIPLNAGSLGYTLNDVEDIRKTAELINSENWQEFSFVKLEVLVKKDGELISIDHVANDVYIERSSGQTARLRFSIDSIPMVQEPVICDAVIVSTALGSTAYNLSAGGSICHPALGAINITFSNAHFPRLPPMIVPRGSIIDIEADEQMKRPIRIVCDGREIDHARKVNRFYVEGIRIKRSNEAIRVAYLNGHNLTAQLAKKIIRR